jgi:predicted metalloprotease with PDZ domain
MTLHTTRRLFAPLAFCIIFVLAPSALAQGDRLRVDYTVNVASVPERLFHITTEISNISQQELYLSLPTWTPGWYTVENYAKNILRFHVTDAKGARLPHRMARKQTWRVETKGINRIKVEYDYRADILALNQAEIREEFAFFTGIQLFLMIEGHRNTPSTVRFEVPEGWKIISALKETADPKIFLASDYDTLVDSPTQMGNFDATRFEVEGKPHYLVTTPAGEFSKEKTGRFVELLSKTFAAQSSIFGGLPYDKYVCFYFFLRPESNAGGALEHANSYVAFAPPARVATPEILIGTASHEFFHTWNVKRIRPAEMWPYDYSRENESPLLWVSEGFTNYYTNVALLRAGIRDARQFLDSVAQAMTNVESNPARNYISPSDASTSTWLGYDTPVAFGISYYQQGQNLGALLDLSIIHDSGGRYRLDDVFRALYKDYYLKGRGFKNEDLLSIINRLSGKDYSDFFRRYVWGVEAPPYDRILGYAGYRTDKLSRNTPSLGLDATMTSKGEIEITRVLPGQSAAEAGLMRGDVLLKIDGQDVGRNFRLGDVAGKTVQVEIRRGEKTQTIDMFVKATEESEFRVIEAGSPTTQQMRTREVWLKR